MNITNLEIAQATIEIVAGIVCVLSAFVILMNDFKAKGFRHIKWMFFVVAILYFAEAGAYIHRGNTDSFSLFATRADNLIVFIFNIVLINLYLRYVYQFICEKGEKPNRIFIRIGDIGILLEGFILAVNLFTGWMYYFDDQNYYHRNVLWYAYAVIGFICLLDGIIMCYQHRNTLIRAARMIMFFYSLAPIVAIVIQTFYYGISFINLGIGIGLVLLFIAYLRDWSENGEKDSELTRNQKKTAETVILFVIMVFIMCTSIISCVLSIVRISFKTSENDSQTIAHMVCDGIDKEFIKPITVAGTMSKDNSLMQYFLRGEADPVSVEKEMSVYLASIRDGFGYQSAFAVSDRTGAYYTNQGIQKYIEPEKNEHDIWYTTFVDSGKEYDLDVDTDEMHEGALSVFVNVRMNDAVGDLLGICGVGVDMTHLQTLMNYYEGRYGIKITLIDASGLVQVDSQGERIEMVSLETEYLTNVNEEEFYYEKVDDVSRLTKYMDSLGWYLVIQDNNPNKLDVREITLPSIVIFLVGLCVLGLVFYMISRQERKAQKELEEKRRISVTDELTGLPNRRAYEEECDRIGRFMHPDYGVLCMLDINGLKQTNDTLGHSAGDELILAAAACMRQTFEEFGNVYRVGGDEFVAMLRCDKERAEDAIKTLIHLTGTWKGQQIQGFTVAVGMVDCEQYPEEHLLELLEMADKLMYEDKDEYYKRTGNKRRIEK